MLHNGMGRSARSRARRCGLLGRVGFAGGLLAVDLADGNGFETAEAGGVAERPGFDGGAEGFRLTGGEEGTFTTSEISTFTGAAVDRFTTTGRAEAVFVDFVLSSPLSFTGFPAGVTLLAGWKTEATGFGFDLSFVPGNLAEISTALGVLCGGGRSGNVWLMTFSGRTIETRAAFPLAISRAETWTRACSS